GLGTANMEKHSIELIEGARVFKDRPYPMSPAKQKVVEDEIDKMLELGVIEESKSPWSNRTTVVSMPGKDRFCLDARKLNAAQILFQRNQDGDEQPIAFFSAKMNKHQVNYSVTEKECLDADLSGRLARWSLQLQGYDFGIEHRKGSENVVADTLSRCIEEVLIDPTELLGFETTEFAAEDYLELVQDVESNRENLPDLKVDGGLIFKRL
ncbi:hypothetical protein KR084_009473, partial [Drosophila pseudotakahashii]